MLLPAKQPTTRTESVMMVMMISLQLHSVAIPVDVSASLVSVLHGPHGSVAVVPGMAPLCIRCSWLGYFPPVHAETVQLPPAQRQLRWHAGWLQL